MIRQLPWWAWLAGVAVLGLVAGIAWPPPPIPKARQDASAWSLPASEAFSRTSAEDFRQASSGLRWTGGSGGDGPQAWRLAGFLNVPPTAVLIETTDEGRRRTRHASAGDTLPDGSRLLSVDGDRIVVELDGCRSVHQLHRKNPVEQQGCGAPGEDTEPRTAQ